MVGGRDYAHAPVQPRHAGPAPAGLGDQAVHPGRGARATASRRARCGRRASASSPSRARRREKFIVNNFESSYAGTQHARRRARRTPTTRSTPRSASAGRARSGSRGSAERMGIRTPVSSNPAMTLGGLKQGVTPLDMAHAYETFVDGGQRVGGRSARASGGPSASAEVDAPGPASRTTQNKCARKRGAHRGHRRSRPSGSCRRSSRSGTGSARRSARAVRGGQDRHDREQRRRLVRRLHRPAHGRGVGRLPGQAQADADRVRRRARSRAAPSRR